ncbi:hemin ABC transporter substrate-binding protein [Stutzerimonas kirkiae]|uniref:Hemin ABC transporter substrate-binding protein n=1 Tax=Stutzerimonas kirkiae TaxID=2211392 RepID=A0A4Q9R7A5_9GAMM|nr:ABC transporter substrate-binding protein [Stutzerimonas kirkiae]TBU95775.1 hemin ABC transporter substrate-binding protein [Stutzerimonas kirkiae]TBV02766.1 hemin ABC transporter substrate-binding protein [Stutzerimonas kirkiae]TBV03740.1 hemin ABC transporter substrate-binding protein [Stutzerimonas kirkiae]
MVRIRAFCCGVGLSLLAQAALAQSESPQRWVSAGGAISEWVVALGAEQRLVGVDSTSQQPSSLRELPSIGYQRQLAAEGILALRPDLLVGSEEMGPPPVLEQLGAAGVRIERLSAAGDLTALQGNVRRLGELLGEPERAEAVLADLDARLARQAHWLREAQRSQAVPGVLLLVGQGGGNLLVAGSGTSADWLLEHSGGHNLASHPGYKAFSSEALAALNPEVLLVTDRSLRGVEVLKAVLAQNPGLAASRAVREERVLVIDPTLLVGGLGPRTLETLASWSAAFYPQQPPLADGAP